MTFGLSAVAVGAIVAGAGAVAKGITSANASSAAAAAQTGGMTQAVGTEQNAYANTQNILAPYTNMGGGATNLLDQLYGIGGGNSGAGGTVGTTQVGTNTVTGAGGGGGSGGGGGGTSTGGANPNNANYAGFYNSPNYQFALTQGENAINRNASANGNLYSTATMNNEDTYAQGVASQQYQSYVGNLLSMAGMGQTAATNVSNANLSTSANIGAAQMGIGNANASGILGNAGAWNSMITGLTSPGSGGGASGGASALSGILSLFS